MPDRSRRERLNPAYQVRVNGRVLPAAALSDLVAITVCQDVEAPSMFVLTLKNWDLQQLRVTWSDADLFSVGREVEIRMGYIDQLDSVLVGEITGLEPEFCADEPPTVLVRGYDRRHRLLRGRKTRSFVQVTDSEIVSQIASGLGLQASATNTGVKSEYVLQYNQTDWEFLQDRARRIGFEVVVEDKTLFFRPHRQGDNPVLTLANDRDLIEFYPRLTTLNQRSQVEVNGWNPMQKAAIQAQATAGSNMNNLDGTVTGPQAVNQAFGQSSYVTVDRPVFSQAEADQIAQGHLDDMALAYISGEGLAVGRSDLRAGRVITIEGMGQRFSGRYYILSTTHTYSPFQGYRTAFTFRRNST